MAFQAAFSRFSGCLNSRSPIIPEKPKMFAQAKMPILAALLVSLFTAPVAQAQPPANLNDCKAHAQTMTQVYAVAIACEKIQDAELDALASQFAAANEDYLDACQKLGLTRETQKAWFKAEEQQLEQQIARRYQISSSDSEATRAQKIAAYCQDEQPRLKKRLQRQFQ